MRNARTGDLFATGKTIHVYFNYQTQKGQPVGQEVREKLWSGIP